MAKIELEAAELKELLILARDATENLATVVTSIQENFKFLKDAPGIEAEGTRTSFWSLHRCIRGILDKKRYSIGDL